MNLGRVSMKKLPSPEYYKSDIEEANRYARSPFLNLLSKGVLVLHGQNTVKRNKRWSKWIRQVRDKEGA